MTETYLGVAAWIKGPSSAGEFGTVPLVHPGDDDRLIEIRAEEIEAFTLIPEPPINRSDELRG